MANQIKVDTEWLNKCSVDLREIGSAIQATKNALGSMHLSKADGGQLAVKLRTRLILPGSSFSGGTVQEGVRALSSAAQKLTDSVSELNRGADNAARIFEEAENKATQLMRGIANDRSSDVYDEGGNNAEDGGLFGKIDWTRGGWKIIDDILDALNIGRYERDYVDPGKEAEQAHDALMQEQIAQLMQDPRYNEAAWEEASTEEKQRIFNAVKNELNRIYGTDIQGDVDYFYDAGHVNPGDGKTYITNGYYSDDSRSIHMNTYNLERRTYEQNMITLVHEMRHAYQHEVVRHPEKYKVSKETAQSWADNVTPGHYKTTEKDGFEAYRSQPIEQDARDFSENIDYV